LYIYYKATKLKLNLPELRYDCRKSLSGRPPILALAVSVHTLSWSIFSHFIAIYPWSVHRSRKSPKKLL